MSENWLENLASDVEANYGEKARIRIFVDLQNMSSDPSSESEWFNNQFIPGMDELDNKDFLTIMMAKHCPCRCSHIEENIQKNYDASKTLEEFVSRLNKDGLFDDMLRLEGNVLYATKYPYEKYGKHNHIGPYTTKCHCNLASCTQKPISDIFCHCCTVGFYSKMFKIALNQDVKVKFISSVISGGEGCTTAIYLPQIKP